MDDFEEEIVQKEPSVDSADAFFLQHRTGDVEPDQSPVKEITIRIIAYENMFPLHQVADLSVHAEYGDQNLGETTKVPLVKNDLMEVANHEFTISVDSSNPKEIDKLISTPLILTATEHAGSFSDDVYPLLETYPLAKPDAPLQMSTVESAADFLDSLTTSDSKKILRTSVPEKEAEIEEKKEKREKKAKEKKEKPKGSTKTKAASGKTTSKSQKNKQGKDSTEKPESEKSDQAEKLPEKIIIGTCAIDFMALCIGQSLIQETYLLQRPKEQRLVEEAQTNLLNTRTLPRLKIEIITKDNKPVFETANVLSLTLESIYNIPQVMAFSEMRHRIAVRLIDPSSKFDWVVFDYGGVQKERDFYNSKKWFSVPETKQFDGSTTYRIERDLYYIRDKLLNDLEIERLLKSDNVLRVQFNRMRRVVLPQDVEAAFFLQLMKTRTLPLELYMSPLPPPPPPTPSELELRAEKEKELAALNSTKKGGGKKDKASKKESKKSSKSSKAKAQETTLEEAEPQLETYLHLMALVDLQPLLYPGISTCRTTCQLRTYHVQEMLEIGGVDQSFFRPKVEVPLPPPIVLPTLKAGKKKEKGSKAGSKKGSKAGSKKGGSKKGSKASKQSDSKIQNEAPPEKQEVDLSDLLPSEPPPPPPPSKLIYDENGMPTFIIVDVTMFKPLVAEKKLSELETILDTLIPKRPELSKLNTIAELGRDYYHEVIRKLLEDLYYQHRQFLLEKEKCTCPEEPAIDLLAYLQKSGTYQTYLTTMTRAASILASDHFQYSGDKSKGNRDYQNFISEIFAFMVTEMNTVINEVVMGNYEGEPPKTSYDLTSTKSLLFYAKEATELQAYALADQYYLERIQREKNNADVLFDYAIFHIEMLRRNTAIECLKEALHFDSRHKNSLLCLGLLLALEESTVIEAESCLVTVTLQYPRWVMGWLALRFYYEKTGNLEGVEVCTDMARKYNEGPCKDMDYFESEDDLAWSSHIVPKKLFFIAAVYFIKLRIYDFAELAISLKMIKYGEICDYLLAVISYYQRKYIDALQHLSVAKKQHGFDHAVGGLIGHCLLQIERPKDAKRQYMRILKRYDKPESLHLINIRAAQVLEQLGNAQKARVIILQTCKFTPTPYTWLAAGLLYLRQNDLISAEECLTESNICDGKLPETWGYLALVNYQLDRQNEAIICYRQAIRNRLRKGTLRSKLEKIFADLGYRQI